MVTYTQANRPLQVTIGSLSPDTLLPVGFSGQEGISQLFSFQLDLIAENGNQIGFDKILGKPVSVTLRYAGGARTFSGICSRFSQSGRDEVFTTYQLQMVPRFWLWTRRAQSRIFQHLTVPEILKQVLDGLDISWQIQGTFHPRDYCVQYRESDFNFASRLMEEEGIYYFLSDTPSGPMMVLANTPQSHPNLPGRHEITYQQNTRNTREAHVFEWHKSQEVRAGKYTLWDHCFELPASNFEATQHSMPEVMVGQVVHKLNGTDLEIYDYPGEYAQRFDGVQPGGADRAADVSKIYNDNQRTVKIRMEEEALSSLVLQGAGNCQQFAAGYAFVLKTLEESLEKQFKADGRYVLTAVQHSAQLSGYRSSRDENLDYRNTFTCIPALLPFRPLRRTPKPFIQGPQTATVVGPKGEEIFTDKYGRVKVQFHWDRQGKHNADSSCWIRAGTPWAGKHWGTIHIPRIGQEVIVAFEEGDMDQPIIMGSVYNSTMMPPYPLPEHKTQSGLKTRSTLQGDATNFNELRFEDKKGSEEVYFHAERDFYRLVENNDTLKVGSDQAPDGSQTIEVYNHRTATVKTGHETVTVEKGDRIVTVNEGDDTHDIKQGNRSVNIATGNDALKIDKGKSSTEATQSIEFKVGSSSIKLDQCGVTIKGMVINVEGEVQTTVKGPITQISGKAMMQVQGGIVLIG
jgi:type VI secretion system secreted protein VgrG